MACYISNIIGKTLNMPITITKLEELVQADYEELCLRVGLPPAPLDIYEIIENCADLTKHGMRKSYPYAGYDQKVIHLPFYDVEIDMFGDMRPPFLPPERQWDMRFNHIWPKWRIDLWHEVIHQYEHQVLHQWRGGNVHGESWHLATNEIAAKLDVPPDSIKKVAWGIAVPVVGGGTLPQAF